MISFMRISIVVPVYNVELYLKQCVDSLLKQGLKDCEIILVDDGSTDASGAICDDYANRYEYVKVIHKENGGLSDARNAGLKEITGHYVVFVDSDDFLFEGALSNITESITDYNIDLVFLEASKIYPDGKCIPMGDGYNASYINGCSKDVVLKHIASLPKFPGSAWAKIIRAKLIIQHELYFQKGLFSEDIDWTVRLLLNARTFSYYPGDYYFYRQGRIGSITSSVGIKNVLDLLSIVSKWASKDLSHPFQQEINAYMAYEYVVLLFNYACLDKEVASGIKKSIESYKWLLSYGKSKKVILVNIAMKIIGFQITAKLLKKYRKIDMDKNAGLVNN